MISYFDKKIYEELVNKDKKLSSKIQDLEHKISLIKNNDLDYIDMFIEKNLGMEQKTKLLLN